MSRHCCNLKRCYTLHLPRSYIHFCSIIEYAAGNVSKGAKDIYKKGGYKKSDYKKGDYKKNGKKPYNKNYNNHPQQKPEQKKTFWQKVKSFFGR